MYDYCYRCGTCRTTSVPVATKVEQLAERDQHRRRVHGGHVPDEEQLLRRRRPGPADFRPIALVLVVLVVLLLSLIAQH